MSLFARHRMRRHAGQLAGDADPARRGHLAAVRGEAARARWSTCKSVKMNFAYKDWFPPQQNVGYETLLYDVMIGDQTLFQRADQVEEGWRIVQPVLDAWAKHAARGLPELHRRHGRPGRRRRPAGPRRRARLAPRQARAPARKPRRGQASRERARASRSSRSGSSSRTSTARWSTRPRCCRRAAGPPSRRSRRAASASR